MVQQLNTPDPIIRGTIIWFFYGSQTQDLEIQMALAKSLLYDPEIYIRMAAATVLRDLQTEIPQIQQAIVKALIEERNENVVRNILECLSRIKLDAASKNQIINYSGNSQFKSLLQDFISKNP